MLCLACGGNRFGREPLVVERCPEWEILLEQAGREARIVGCAEDALSLVTDEPIEPLTDRWVDALEADGRIVHHRQAPWPALDEGVRQVEVVLGPDDEEELALAISRTQGVTHLSLVRLR